MANIRVNFTTTLVYCDSPQLILLRHAKSVLLGVAIPSGRENDFLVTSVSPGNLQMYFDQEVDLRFIFTYPHRRQTYIGVVQEAEGPSVLTRFTDIIPDRYLPERGFFSREHTSDFRLNNSASDTEKLALDGQWELQDFGGFQQRYSDLYAFSACLANIASAVIPEAVRNGIRSAFLKKPLRGGSSYGSLFADLEAFVPIGQKLRLSKISKASPGFLEMTGKENLFDETQRYIVNYLSARKEIDANYKSLYEILQAADLLGVDVAKFDEAHPLKPQIIDLSNVLMRSHGLDECDQLASLCQKNSLSIAKVTLALHRRVEGASVFFAQGRVEFS